MLKPTEVMYQSSQEELDEHVAKINQAFEAVGGKQILVCDSSAFSDQWTMFGISEYPDIEAVQKHQETLNELRHLRYVDSQILLGTKTEMS